MNHLFDQIKNIEEIIALTEKVLLDNPENEALSLALKQKDEELVRLCTQLGYEEAERTKIFSSSIKDMRSRWSKHYSYYPIVYAPAGRESVFCFGYLLIDEFLKEISVAHINENIFSKSGIKLGETFDPDWVFDIFKKRLERDPVIANHLEGDSYFGKRSIGSSLYLDHARVSNADTVSLGGWLAEYKVRPATEYAKERLIRESMIDLGDDDIVTFRVSMKPVCNKEEVISQ